LFATSLVDSSAVAAAWCCSPKERISFISLGVINMNSTSLFSRPVIALFAAALGFVLLSAMPDDAQAGVVRGAVANPQGGTTAGMAKKRVGPNGGVTAAARGAVSDGQGNAVGGSARVAQGPNGAKFARGGKFQKNADGSASRSGGYSASGARDGASSMGSASAQGNVTRAADGTVTGTRDSTYTNANTGTTANVDRTYQSGQGVTKTKTCTDAAGATIACPR
jgi:hypothetical protein